MFRKKTLFVVGAGASAEIRFSLGKGLIKLIANDLIFHFEGRHLKYGEENFYQLIRNQFRDPKARNEHVRASRSAKSLCAHCLCQEYFLCLCPYFDPLTVNESCNYSAKLAFDPPWIIAKNLYCFLINLFKQCIYGCPVTSNSIFITKAHYVCQKLCKICTCNGFCKCSNFKSVTYCK